MADDVERLLDGFSQAIRSDGDYEGLPSKLDMRHHPPGTERESWQKCSELAEKYDKGLCEAYREQIDTLLVFAGLFSAVVTSFAVESYQWLHDDSGDVSVQLLSQIANILNGTSPLAPAPATSALSNAVAARINTYWFLSLSLSLAAALVGILAKQWIREYDRDVGRTHPESLGVRQMKFDGLEAWKVYEIVSSVPLLLQFALALFFLGIVELLWQLHPAVAIPVTTVAILVLAFYVITAILPTVDLANWYRTPRSTASQCPYKSPQAWIVLRAALRFIMSPAPTKNQKQYFQRDPERFQRAEESIRRPRSWISLDLAWTALSDAETARNRPEYKFQALAWLRQSVDHADLSSFIWHCLRQPASLLEFSHRFRANLLCCIPRSEDKDTGSAVVPYQDIPCVTKLDPLELSNLLSLAYARMTSMPEIIVVELFCRLFLGSFQKFNEEDFYWFAEHCILIKTLIPSDLCRAIYVAVREITRSNAVVAAPVLDIVDWFIACCEPSQHRTMLILAMCELARRWLDANGDYGSVGDEDRIDRIERCRAVLASSVSALQSPGSRPFKIPENPPYNLTTLALAHLAKDVDLSGRYLLTRGVDAMASWLPGERHRLRRLVGIAESYWQTSRTVVSMSASIRARTASADARAGDAERGTREAAGETPAPPQGEPSAVSQNPNADGTWQRARDVRPSEHTGGIPNPMGQEAPPVLSRGRFDGTPPTLIITPATDDQGRMILGGERVASPETMSAEDDIGGGAPSSSARAIGNPVVDLVPEMPSGNREPSIV